MKTLTKYLEGMLDKKYLTNPVSSMVWAMQSIHCPTLVK